LEYKGVKYKEGMLLVLKVIFGECLFGEIHHILINNTIIIYFAVRPLLTVGFNPHVRAYEVDNKIMNSQFFVYCVTELPDTTPTVSRILNNGKLFVTLRSMI